MYYIYTCILFIYVDGCDNNVALIGAVVGVDCTVIIIMVITNIMVWIYWFRKRHHTCAICKGLYTYIRIYVHNHKNERTIQARGIDLCLLALHYH